MQGYRSPRNPSSDSRFLSKSHVDLLEKIAKTPDGVSVAEAERMFGGGFSAALGALSRLEGEGLLLKHGKYMVTNAGRNLLFRRSSIGPR